MPDARMEQPRQRHAVSPHLEVTSAASHGHVYAPAMTANAGPYSTNAMGPAGLGLGPSAGHPPDLRLAVPVTTAAANQTTSWHQPSAHYSSDPSATGREPWAFPASYMSAAPATGMPGSAQSYQSYRMPPMNPQAMSADNRPMSLHAYDVHGQPTTTS